MPVATTEDSQNETNSALLSGALNALALDRAATARDLIEQMLDRNDLTAAASALSSVSESQLWDPDIAYVRGRLTWQQMVVGSEVNTSPADALRDWNQAVESRPDFLEAWVALGFAHMALNDYDQAITAWQRAIAIDQSQRLDIDPAAGPQVFSPMTINAYAGLAMAYFNESSITLLPTEQTSLEQQAQGYFAQVLSLDPTIVNPNVLELNWLWSPALIADWQTTVGQLAINSSGT